VDDGDKQQETTATTTATRVIHEAAQAHDGAERDGGQAGGLGTAVCCKCMDKVRDKQSKICRGGELEMMTEVEFQ
jgi:hypothetical protein